MSVPVAPVPAYLVIVIDVKDPAKYAEYGQAFDFQSFAEKHGGEFLVIADEPDEVIEGKWNVRRLVVMKFPDAEKARAWYDSPEYREVRKLRWASTTSSIGLFPGFDLNAALAARTAGA